VRFPLSIDAQTEVDLLQAKHQPGTRGHGILLLTIACICLSLGCGKTPAPTPSKSEVANPTQQKSSATNPPSTRPVPPKREPTTSFPPPGQHASKEVAPQNPPPQAVDPAATTQPKVEPRPIDEARVQAAGIRKLPGKYLTLYTDLPANADIDQLPALFEQAYPQWCDYFGKPDQAQKPWHINGCLMLDRNRFVDAGLIPADLPKFKNGYSLNHELWLFDQPSPYYRRHLLLHEGTHAFMNTVLGGSGQPWYMEGVAELLATHRLADGRLTLNYFPAHRDEVPQLGRIRIVHDAVAAGRAKKITEVLGYGPTAHLENEPYGWCWALAAFLDGHSRYRDRFRKMPADVREPDFLRRFAARFAADWADLAEEWQVFAHDLEYGYDLQRAAVDFAPGQPLTAPTGRATIAADHGWQSTRLQLQAGVTYRISATGRFQLATEPKIWWSEPNGVSFRYYKGRPLGLLLGVIRPDPDPGAPAGAKPASADPDSAFLQPLVIGPETTLTPTKTGTLYLRVNDSSAELRDNAGTIQVTVARD
jgi:hypothetical protein